MFPNTNHFGGAEHREKITLGHAVCLCSFSAEDDVNEQVSSPRPQNMSNIENDVFVVHETIRHQSSYTRLVVLDVLWLHLMQVCIRRNFRTERFSREVGRFLRRRSESRFQSQVSWDYIFDDSFLSSTKL